MSKFLFLIPARGGSKGVPQKNIKFLANKPLICHSIDIARQFAGDADICVSTDDKNIISVVENYGLRVPFVRPEHLSTDEAGSYEVMLQAIKFYKDMGINYDAIVFLQPTSPFRKHQHIKEAIELFQEDIDMVVSVKKAKNNPFYNTFFINRTGFLEPFSESKADRRQDAPEYYHYNGSLYIINVTSLVNKTVANFSKIRKYEMDEIHSVDLDTELDFLYSEFLVEKKLVSL